MGLCNATGGRGEMEIERQKAIERMIKSDRAKLVSEVKLLLLGAGQSGKSTLAKQMKILYLEGFSEEERKAFREIVCSNIFAAVRELVMGLRRTGLSLLPQNEVRSEWGCVTEELVRG